MVLVASGPFGGGSASGSIASSTYSHNRFGQYVRNRTTPVNPQSAAQVEVRAALAQLTTRWAQTLTQAQRDAWDLYGSNVTMKNKLGQDILLTGFNHYLRSNVILVIGGQAPVDAGPVLFELPDQDPTLAIAGSEATQQITVTYDDTLGWANETGAFMWFFQGIPQNAQRTFFGGPWRAMGGVSGVTGAPPPSPAVVAVTFAIAQGERQWLYARIGRADGRLSQRFQANVLIGA